MKSILFTLFFLVAGGSQAVPFSSHPLKNTPNMTVTEKQAIEQLLGQYEQALNASSTPKILELYTEDGVFMPSQAPTSVGKTAVAAAYNFVFSQIQLNIAFSIDEIEVIGDWAFARTISKGTTKVLAAGMTVPEENRELFVLKKQAGQWKIARYIFNKMSAPAQ